MTQVKYSVLSANDIANFYPFFADCLSHLFPEYTKETINYFIEKDYHQSWMGKVVSQGDKILHVAKVEDKFAGFLLVNKVYGGVGVASWLAVNPKFQHQGIATELVKIWEKDSLANYAHALHLWTTDDNVDFYLKRGFVNCGTFKDAWFGVDMPMMYKTLQSPKEENYLHKYLVEKNER